MALVFNVVAKKIDSLVPTGIQAVCPIRRPIFVEVMHGESKGQLQIVESNCNYLVNDLIKEHIPSMIDVWGDFGWLKNKSLATADICVYKMMLKAFFNQIVLLTRLPSVKISK